MKRKKKSFKKFIIITILLIIAYPSYVTLAIWLYGNVDQTAPADAALVLGAAAWHNNPSPVFEERIKHGIWLYENGYVDYIIFTGGKSEGAEYSESFVAREYALARGVPIEAIMIEEQSRTTQENLFYARGLVESNHLSTVILVSDPLHMRRAMRIARDYGFTAYSSPTPTTRYESLNTQLPFLRREVFFYISYKISSLLNI